MHPEAPKILCFMKIGVKGMQLCDWNILTNQASTDGWTEGQTNRVLPVYPLTSLRGL